MIRRFEASLQGAQLFLMDQGYKRKFAFNDPEMRDSVLRLLEYKNNSGEADRYRVPAFPDRLIDDIPSGPNLTIENFNEPWSPSEFLSEAEDLRIELDPSDARLDPRKYNNDYTLYRRELEKDIREKTNYIDAVDKKIAEIRKEIQNQAFTFSIAIFFNLDPEFVSFHHIIRLLMILFIVPLILKLILKKSSSNS